MKTTLGTQSISQHPARRRRWLAAGLAAMLTLAIGVVGIAYWQSSMRKDSSVVLPKPLPKNVDQQLSGYTYTRSEGQRKIFTVHAARTISLTESGSTVLQDVYVEIFGPAGTRYDVLRTEKCDYDPKTQELFAAGKVSMELNDFADEKGGPTAPPFPKQDPVYVETSQVHFTQQGTIVQTDQPVSFRTSRGAGTAQGMTYNTRTNMLDLLNDVALKTPAGRGSKPLAETTLTADKLHYDKEKQEIDLQGPINVTQADGHVSGGRGKVVLQGSNRLRQLLLEDHVRGTDTSQGKTMETAADRIRADFAPVTSDLQKIHAEGNVEGRVLHQGRDSRLSAHQFEIAFSGAHPHPLDGVATGNVELSIESQPAVRNSPGSPPAGGKFATSNQELKAGQLKFSFRPAQQTLKEAETVGTGQIDLLPADPKSGKREIFGDPLVMNFDDRSRLQTLVAPSKARVVFHPASQAPAESSVQESSSDHLKATFDPASGALLVADQSGNFQYQQDKQHANAGRALYDGRSELLALTGHPEITDPDTQVRADRIDMDTGKGLAEGFDHVRSTHLEAPDAAKPQAKALPTNVVADRMLARRDTQYIHYEGHVRLWHGADVIEAPALDVYKKERRVTSGSRVMSSFIQPAPANSQDGASQESAKKPASPVTITGDRLDYTGYGRKATYSGHVVLTTENTTMRADHLDVYLNTSAAPDASQVDHAVADGNVSVVQPTRRSTGEHAEYIASIGKILLTGGPPTVLDQENGFMTGRSLTLFLRDDTILVNGGVQSPTISKHKVSQ